MKKLKAMVLGGLLLLQAVQPMAFAVKSPLQISKISVDQGLIQIDTENQFQQDVLVTLTVVKENTSISQANRLYAIEEETLKAGEKKTFLVKIPELKDGEKGTGDYRVTLMSEHDSATQSFSYADAGDVADFLVSLQEAAAGVTVPDKAYEVLKPIVELPENVGVLFTIGIDLSTYNSQNEAIKNETLNELYQCNLATMDVEKLSEAFSGSFGLSIYNNGEREKGISLMALRYNGERIDESVANSFSSGMNQSYLSVEALKQASLNACGLDSINKANISSLGAVMEVFKQELNICVDKINRVNNLSSKTKAYEYILQSVNKNKLTSISQLENLLDAAVLAATTGGTGGGGFSGGGGGAVGSGINSAQMGSNSYYNENMPKLKSEKLPPFADVPADHWAVDGIRYLKQKGIVIGTETGNYEPERLVFREEFTKMVVEAAGLQLKETETEFIDVVKGAWYEEYIATAFKGGVIRGVGGNRFGIGQTITRQDMAVIIARVMERWAITLPKNKDYVGFKDEASVADYAMDAIRTLYEAGVINGIGDNQFNPTGNATRAEAAKIICEAFGGNTV